MDSAEITQRLESDLFQDRACIVLQDAADFKVANPLVEGGVPPTRVVRPRDAAQVQELVRLANEAGLNLTVVSSTGEHRKGGFASAGENILVDLSHWKGIEWVDRRNRVCLIQPGVTYGELLETLGAEGMTLSAPLAPRSGKSVVASVIDREPSTWPNKQWDIADPTASTEFVFGTGDLFRTGAAGGPGSLQKQRASGGAQKCPEGPSQTDFHRVVMGSQGTMGIVTWITLRTELKPSVQKPFLLGDDSLDRLIPYVYNVQRPWLGEHSFILDRNALALLIHGTGGGAFEKIRDGLPKYVCLQNIAGFERLPKERVKYQEKDIKALAKRRGLALRESIGEVSALDLLETAVRPCGTLDWRLAHRGQCLSVFFLTTLDRAPGLLDEAGEAAREAGLDAGTFGAYLQPVVQNHACHVELLVPYDPEDRREVERMRLFEAGATARLIKAGAFFSRPYGAARDLVFRQNPLNHEVLKQVKGIFDPNRVLNRGKWGL